MEAIPKEVILYETSDGNCPFNEWFMSLRNQKASNKIAIRLRRIEQGNLGDYKSVGKGVCEIRIDYGAGYRVYFGQVGD